MENGCLTRLWKRLSLQSSDSAFARPGRLPRPGSREQEYRVFLKYLDADFQERLRLDEAQGCVANLPDAHDVMLQADGIHLFKGAGVVRQVGAGRHGNYAPFQVNYFGVEDFLTQDRGAAGFFNRVNGRIAILADADQQYFPAAYAIFVPRGSRPGRIDGGFRTGEQPVAAGADGVEGMASGEGGPGLRPTGAAPL